MKITVINGSMRHVEHSQSLKVSRYLLQALKSQSYCRYTHLISMTEKPYPLWNEGVWDGEPEWKALLEPIGDELATSDGFVVVVPEYHGMAPAALKNFLLMHNKYQIGHKPALLVGVSSSDGGAYPVAEMRMSSTKNNRLCYIPEQLILRHVETVLNEKNEDNNAEADAYFRERIDFALTILGEYAKALKQVRASNTLHNEKFSNGM